MRLKQYGRLTALATAMFCICLTAALAQKGEKKSYTFKGKVEKVDLAAKTISVNGEKVEGWMNAMTMNYAVDKEAVLKTLKAGDQITAKVYEGDLVLHDVQVVPPAKSSAPPAKK